MLDEIIAGFTNIEDAKILLQWQSFVFLVAAVVVLWIGKKIYDLAMPFSVDHELTHVDNKALAVSYFGYLIAQGIIVWYVLTSPGQHDLVKDLIGMTVWSLVGILLLNACRWINDRIILAAFSNKKELIEDRNIGVGAAQAGSYIGTALLLGAIVAGEQSDLTTSLIGAGVFFALGQGAFIVFSLIYRKFAGYDVLEEIEEHNNPAAGVSFGMTLVAIGMILSNSVMFSMSVIAFVAWFILGGVLIFVMRALVDFFILPSHKVGEEIAKDQNWGVALVEGGSAVIVAILLTASF
jgi:uncharacterized membrane protein YjfL (UPF0719 family)